MKLSQEEKTKLRTWVEIDRDAVKANYKTFKNIVGDRILMAVVKSNAYGCGLVLFSKELVKNGVNFFGVDSFDEALELRDAGIKVKILVLGYVSPLYYKEAIQKDISLTISNFTTLEALRKIKINKKLNIHIKVDTGLGRQGFFIKDIKKVLKILKSVQKNVQVEGLYSHLAMGEDLSKEAREYTEHQVNELNTWYEEFIKEKYKPLKHICASAATMFYLEYHFDMVRVGIGMYGLWSSKETKFAMEKKYPLYPVLSWKAIITEVKIFPKGISIGYDLTEKLKRNSKLAIIAVGYWHGYPRVLSRKGTFNVQGKKVKIIGSVCMDMIVLDVTGLPVKVGSEVAIIGGDYGHYAEVDVMAQDSDTINYEINTRINPIIKRFYRINPLIKRFLK
ncbi:MAG: alanine racemase [Patescibacteria group bacterium]